ncbi:MAG: ferric aerobactin receptor, partial [Schleiferiaceae bacterium]
GGDFGVIGNQLAEASSTGRAYGAEFTYHQTLYKGWFGIAAVTLVRSEFSDYFKNYVPSSWDNRMIATFTFGKKFGKNWELGGQYQHLGGAPYTPFDLERSANIQNWNVFGRGLPDFSRLNSERFGEFDRLNIRVDKKWFFKKWNLDLYMDVQNALAYKLEGPAFIDVVKFLDNTQGIVQPGIGIIVDF